MHHQVIRPTDLADDERRNLRVLFVDACDVFGPRSIIANASFVFCPVQALREEQVWMATSYVQLYAFVSSVWSRVKRATTALGRDGNAASNW
jgi:hypothetical protein